MLLDQDTPAEDLASLKAVTVGTAPLNPDLADRFEARYGIAVLALYGATEFAGGVAGWTLADRQRYARAKRGSVGRAHGDVELRVIDADSGEPLPFGETGLLEVRAPQLGDGWLRTNDLAELDADGFLWIRGRADDAIIRGGLKISAGHVADILRRHPQIRDAVVLGVPTRASVRFRLPSSSRRRRARSTPTNSASSPPAPLCVSGAGSCPCRRRAAARRRAEGGPRGGPRSGSRTGCDEWRGERIVNTDQRGARWR